MEEGSDRYTNLLRWIVKKKIFISIGSILVIFSLIIVVFNNMQRIDAEKDMAVSFEKMVEFLQTGKYFEAIEIAEMLQKTKSNSEYKNLSGLLLAQLLIFNNQEVEAEDVLLNIIKTKGHLKLNQVAVVRLIRLYISQNEYAKAHEMAKKNKITLPTDSFKEILADLEANKGNHEIAYRLYEELIMQARVSGQSPELFILKKNNLNKPAE